MTLYKAIEHKKEKRKPYYGSKSIDKTCRNMATVKFVRIIDFIKI